MTKLDINVLGSLEIDVAPNMSNVGSAAQFCFDVSTGRKSIVTIYVDNNLIKMRFVCEIRQYLAAPLIDECNPNIASVNLNVLSVDITEEVTQPIILIHLLVSSAMQI